MPYRVLNMQTGGYLTTLSGVDNFSKRKDIIGALKLAMHIEAVEAYELSLESEEEQLKILLGNQWQLERINNE